MSTLLITSWGRTGVPSEENDVRATTNVVRGDDPSAVALTRPEYNSAGYERDSETEGGLTDRNLGPFVTPTVKYAPIVGNANDDLNGIVDRQVSTSGSAAAREIAGQYGHGTLQVMESIEPTIREGASFGESYFDAQTRQVQRGMRSDLTSARIPDASDAAADQGQAARATREAQQAAIYARFLESRTGG